MKPEHQPPVKDLLDTDVLRDRYDDAAEQPRERATGNVGLVLISIALGLALLWAMPAEAATVEALRLASEVPHR